MSAAASSISRVGVVGGGQMGQGIAQVAAQAGLDVVLCDASAELAAGAVAKLGKSWDKLVEKGKLSAADADAARARVRAGTSHADLADRDLVVEAAPEREALKLELFTSLSAHCRADAILASNTSSISITKIAAAATRPERVIGMHFMNPVPVMKLVEVIRGLATSDATLATTLALAERMGKTCVVARDVPGFIVNRILIPLLNEACFALFEGLGSARDIDTGVKLGLNHPMGPLELADFIGLDTCLAIAEVLHRELGDDKYRPCPLLRQHVAAGWLGKKAGRGFYDYRAGAAS
ncbi:MAG: 3-hydroxybutyryl-CoA dehydrogenase [Kofleriaceae bacterium]|nr:3-hydroxybutyryl-CoA dehydrogenase [Kofleriaceae bacterium]MBP6839419.1 3-hydroxybutyryl-CoA dehydrogenase [Kofleriaceae bacterium]MBP9205459.1 3-hydroxybutyryl-CoA dehydrogenase [Kofleriaceae bacterium]